MKKNFTMKKINFFFLIVESVICIAGGVHTLVGYFWLLNNKLSTSLPPSACVITLIPYTIAFCTVGIIWLVFFLVMRMKKRKLLTEQSAPSL